MYRFLDESFWRNEFIVTQKQVGEILHRIEDVGGPVSEIELAESLVREALEREQEFANARIYSPEQKYTIGERLVFIHEKGAKYAEVLQVIPAGGPNNEYGCYKKIYVRFREEFDWKIYVCDCPGFPLRFSKAEAENVESGSETGFITPGQLVTQFRELILSEMRRALSGDGRFIYHDAEWYLADEVVPINLDLVEQFLRNAGKPLFPEAILEELFPGKRHERNPAVYLFSLNLALDRDAQRRFARIEKGGTYFWVLQAAVPPERSRYKVTEAALKEGYIEISPGLRQMLVFYEMGPRLVFSVYGGYEIEGEVDDTTNRVYGSDITSWYLENGVRPGDMVYVKAPEPGRKILRLYTEDHEGAGKRLSPGVERDHQRVFLRHRIHGLFVESEQFMHYRELAERLSSRLGAEISPESVDAVLSQSGHLFARLGPSRGLWGLRQWLTLPYDFRIDLISLLLDIGELQLVYKILKQNSRPMHAKEIAEAISGAYGVSPRLLIEANFIDPQDSRLFRFSSGKWGLAEWKEQWRHRLLEIDRELEEIGELVRRLHEQRLLMNQTDHSINLLQAQWEEKVRAISLLAEKQNELKAEAEQVKERIASLEASDSDLQRQETRALAEREKYLKARRQQLVLAFCGGAASLVFWRMGSLALGASVGALSLIPLCFGLRAHSQCSDLFSLVSGLRVKRMSAEYKVKRLRGDVEAIDERIQTGAQGLETLREALAECGGSLAKLEQLRQDSAAALDSLEQGLSGYDKAALLVEREQLLGLMSEVHQ